MIYLMVGLDLQVKYGVVNQQTLIAHYSVSGIVVQ